MQLLNRINRKVIEINSYDPMKVINIGEVGDNLIISLFLSYNTFTGILFTFNIINPYKGQSDYHVFEIEQ